MYTQKNFYISLLGLRWNDWPTYTPAQAPKTWALLYQRSPAAVFGTVSAQLLAEMGHCLHCTLHSTNRRMLKSFAQPGSQLRDLTHTTLHAPTSEVSAKKKLRTWKVTGIFGRFQGDSSFIPQNCWARPAGVNQHNFGDLLQIRCFAPAADRRSDGLAAEIKGLLSGLGLSLLAKYLQQRVFWDKCNLMTSTFY